MISAADARRHLIAIASAPRPAGSSSEAAAREHCADFLRGHGFSITEEPFEFSAVPGLLATPVAGILAVLALATAAWLGARGAAAPALGVLGGSAAILGAGAWYLARRGVLDLGLLRRRGVNLVATRDGSASATRLWLVAHLDSKSQPVPIGLRAVGIVGIVAAWIVASGLALAQLAGRGVPAAWPWVGAVSVLVALPVAASTVGARSAGALDNASGVVSALLVASALPRSAPFGVLLTSAEELGLAGARAWVRGRGAGIAINFDGVDDLGGVRFMWTRRAPLGLLRALLGAAEAARVPARAGRVLPGILVDAVALADAGWDAVTVSKGTVRTVTRIHSARDTVESLTGDGIASVAALVVDAIHRSPEVA
ncbi:MAG: M28 family peptidase [Gemmatimonadaceae bacterium]